MGFALLDDACFVVACMDAATLDVFLLDASCLYVACLDDACLVVACVDGEGFARDSRHFLKNQKFEEIHDFKAFFSSLDL